MARAGDGGQGQGEGSLSAWRVESFRRLMAAEERIAQALASRGVSDAQLQAALDAAEEQLPRDEHDRRDFFAAALESYVTALGGRLDRGAAIFADVTVAIDTTENPG